MDTFLRFAFLPLILAAVYRYLSAAGQHVPWYDVRYISTGEITVFVICVGLALLSFWHSFLRLRCPQCKAVNPRLRGEQEIDRFVGTKKVNGRDGEGRTTVHHVSTTFARVQYKYVCSNDACNYLFHTVGKREVT